MASNNNGAGSLKERVVFGSREEVDRGDGVTVGEWNEHFTRWASFQHLRGGESVQAARLQGQHTIIIRVRACPKTRTVTTDWRARDERTGTLYAVKDIEVETNRAFISFTCQSGVAVG
ncbi:phage head closure protein [Agrobacterium vitis]|uniref:phage head closure protein n=1 Tax=Agrobacterium vitis TaxID=373 RepID=UPI0008DBF85F|nr:phage head closure protein [Agrobacterium vitis]MUO83997.1 phage head closure protein [Agrobacterium vitis]